MKTEPERITLKKIGADILEQLNLERGLGYTIKQFALRPGRAVQEFLYEDRSLYTKPFSFLLLTTAVTTFLMLEFVIKKNLDTGGITSQEQWEKVPELLKPGLELIGIGFRKYFNLVYLSSLPAVSVAAYWVFRKKYPFNLAEFLIINVYVFSIQSLLYIFNVPFFAIGAASVWTSLPSLLLVLYFVYAYRQIFELTIWRAILYSAVVYLIAQMLNLIVFAMVVLVAAVVA